MFAMRRKHYRVAVGLGAMLSLSGCLAAVVAGGVVGKDKVDAKMDRKHASAEAIGHDLNYRTIRISGVEKDGDIVKWTAITTIGRYLCSQHAGLQHATCRPE
ncbi:MAG TPA: hypothetical protein VFW19_13425 [Allosphingosinicella sp.]|nr:hypothetical protein [Allosphingosinicella sp.]